MRYQILQRRSLLGNKDGDAAGGQHLHRPFANGTDDERLHALLRKPLGKCSRNVLGSLHVGLTDDVPSGEVSLDEAEVRGPSKVLGK